MKAILLLAAGAFLVNGFCQETTIHGSAEPSPSKHYEDDDEHNDDYDHKAILGTAGAVDEFSKLSPEEAKKRLGVVVDQMDTDKNGVIETDELVKWIKSSFLKMNVEDTRERMESDDLDSDGQITWEEYMNAIYSMPEEDLDDFKNAEFNDPKKLRKFEISFNHTKARFTAADLNGDSQLNAEEYAAFNYPSDYPHLTSVEADRTMVEYDRNGDGKVDEKEYLNDPKFSQLDEENRGAESSNFRYQDKNRDGSLSREEIFDWLSPNLDEIADEESEHLFSETDKDKDGQLTKQEILDEHELWVGSEATDYGNLLLAKDEL